ncbi:hypothetical protein BDY21DRAFT_361899 [Lineolata rhizophorae]|uniref:chitinase n=1 Tax=Lineolata rhizophorae TaxID=578093 RepID=A0A6A6P7P8_9PEZI|nr:hypothetical protein BDY21DRAFT_361899 [Lineolata rhizophorae]
MTTLVKKAAHVPTVLAVAPAATADMALLIAVMAAFPTVTPTPNAASLPKSQGKSAHSMYAAPSTEGCQSNCGHPGPPAGGNSLDVKHRVIGYYEAWGDRRECHQMSPQGIPIDGLTHVNFAFAFIEPGTYKMTTMDSATPASLFRDVADIKSLRSGNGDLEVFVAVGGWTFSNNGTDTQPLFGEISADESKRQRFADNVVDFMELYGFDGLDIDWEYPGAPDRGGNPEDTENFVKLVKTLRQTFDSRPRKYGLTFTIPSSYWYLRWFDLPGMVEHVDWINLMSYDLHGFWDRLNPIGAVVHGHTNLTEIKQATELLWRVGVPPGKVVLGTGFYGRSFELQDPSCSTPGCPFGGLSHKGPCTGEGGILGYFEIMDILGDARPDGDDSDSNGLKRRASDPVHLEQDAVKYITYDDNQWVSYDDEETFTQKIDWANEVGLGGLMIWAVDLDDTKFTALSGLVQRDIGIIVPPDPGTVNPEGKSVSQSWTNGGKCFISECVADHKHPCDETPGYIKVGSKVGCDSDHSYHEDICCPTLNAPSQCQWRGGSDGGGSPFSPPRNGYRKFCCPKPKPFKNCHWVGKGDCADNTCTNSEGEDDGSIELMTDTFGDSSSSCHWGRKKVCCCNPPDISPFLPVPLEDLFPELPDPENAVKYDLQAGLSHTGTGKTAPNNGVLGFVVIDGPKNAVSNANKRDGSHLEFIDCDNVNGEERQAVRYVCTVAGLDSNCDDMFLDGIEGTILKMPDNCGPGTWAVAHEVRVSSNQTLPAHLDNLDFTVMELTFDYNFGLSKRDSGDIYMRVDYSSVSGYWRDVVDEPGSLRKRALEGRGFGNNDWWSSKFDDMRSKNDYREISKSFNQRVFSNKKNCPGSKSYLDINAVVNAAAKIRWGYTIIGTIVPWSVNEAAMFFDTETDMKIDLQVSAFGRIENQNELQFPLLRTPLTDYAFSHPGIGHFRPWWNADIGASGDVELNGNFTVSYYAQTNGPLRQSYPSALGTGGQGGASMSLPNDPFRGSIEAASSSGGMKIRTFSKAGLEIVMNKYGNTGELMGVNATALTDTYAAVKMNDGKYSIQVGGDKAGISLDYAFGSTEEIPQWRGDADESHSIGVRPGAKQVAAGSPGDDDNDPSKGPKPHYIEFDGSAVLHGFKNMLQCPTNLKRERDCNDIICTTSNYFDCDDGEQYIDHRPGGSSKKFRRDLKGLYNRWKEAKTEHEKQYWEDQGAAREILHELEGRADGERRFQVVNPATGQLRTVRYNDADFPSSGDWEDYPEGDEQYDHALAFEDMTDCEETQIVTRVLPDVPDPEVDIFVATEHIFEQQTPPRFHADAAARRLPDGTRASVPEDNIAAFYLEAFTQRDWLPANTPAMPGGEQTRTVAERLVVALGSTLNRAQFVLLERTLNLFKARMMAQNQIIDIDNFRANMETGDDPVTPTVAVFRNIEGVINYLNHDRVNPRLMTTLNLFRTELRRAETHWNNQNPNRQIRLVDAWDEWIREFFLYFISHTRIWVARAQAEAQSELGGRGAFFDDGLATINTIVQSINSKTINTNGLDAPGS